MAAARPAVGSAKWIAQERAQANEYLDQELDDFRISAQNELEWLNENMADIFAKSKLKFADVFKTPSKLRGKTPRTIRKTEPRSARAPLTDIFAPNLNNTAPSPLPQSPLKAYLPKPISPPKPVSRQPSPQRITGSESTFVSAKEHDSSPAPETQTQPEPEPVAETKDVDVDVDVDVEMEDAPAQVQVYESNDEDMNVINNKENKENNVEMEDLEAQSEASSPEQEQPLHRKSSFTFSSLPAREPLHQKFKSTSILPNMPNATEATASQTTTEASQSQSTFQFPSQSTTFLSNYTADTEMEPDTLISHTEAPLHKSISTPVLSKVAAEIETRTPVRPTMHQKAASTTVVPSPAATETETTAHKNRLWSAIKSAKKIFASSAGTSAAAKIEAHSNDEELANPPTTTKAPAPSTGKLKAPGRLARPTKEAPQSKPAPAIIRVASQSQRLGQGHASQPSFSKSTTERSAPPSRDGTSRAPPPMAGRVKALEAAAKKKEADERAVAKKAEQKLELERKRTEAKAQKEADERKRAEVKMQKEADERKRAEVEERRRAEVKAQKEAEERRRAEAKAQKEAEAKAQKEAEESRSRAAHDLAESIKRERAAQNPPHPRSDVPGTLRQLTKTLKPALKRPMENPPPADAKRRRTNEEQDEQMGGMGQSRPSVMAPPKRPSMMRKENIGKLNHGYSHAPPPAAHHANGMYKPSSSAQMQHLQHKPQYPSHLVQMSSARIPFAGSESSTERHYVPAQAQPMAPTRNPFSASESSHQQYHHPGPAQNPQMYKTPARPVAHMVPKSSAAPKSAGTILGDNIELPDIMTDSEDEDDEDNGGFRVPSWAATPALKIQLEEQQLVDPETVFGPIGEMNMEEMFKNGKNSERLKQFRNRGSSALWVENRDQITSAEKRRDRELRAKMVKDGGWTYDPGAMRRE